LGDHLVLVGLMGSGKTTVGREVARRLGRPFLDSDDQIEAGEGRTVREIWTTDGEPAYRRLEARVLTDAVTATEPSVIAAAGGVVLDPANRERLRRAGAVVWLDGAPETLAARAASGDHRPLLDGDPVATLRSMSIDRRSLYEEVADHVVDVTHRSPDEVVERVLALAVAHEANAANAANEAHEADGG
jgi:shikimate kinase